MVEVVWSRLNNSEADLHFPNEKKRTVNMKLQLHLLRKMAATGFVKIFNEINEVTTNRTFFSSYSSLINYLLETCLLKCI